MRPREIARAVERGREKAHPTQSHTLEKRYSRVRLPRKSPPGIFAAGHLRARKSPPLRSRENWEHRGRLCVRRYMRVYVLYVRTRVSLCMCGTPGIRGILLRRWFSEGSEGDSGDRLIAHSIVGVDQQAKASRAKMRAIFDIRGTFIAALLS